MGNACCKRPGYELIDNENSSEQRKIKENNNLELYLNDVLEKECSFKAEQEEAEFIKTGIETLVQEIVNKVLSSESLGEHFEDLLINRPDLKRYLVESYFPMKASSLKVNVKLGGQSIIKVGSIYEGTKNNFPDEFDFMFLLLFLRHGASSLWTYLKHIVEKCICSATGSLFYAPSAEISRNERKLYFDKYMNRHGPAYMLRFIYNNGSGEERYIHVDLVPAYKVIAAEGRFSRYFETLVQPKSFKDVSVSPSNMILSVRHDLSLTETEVHFVRNILSKNHKVVYRILKFLINGHEDHASLDHFIDTFEKADKIGTGYTSYMIKTMMIYHHDECTNHETANIGPCVLEEMCKYEDVSEFPSILKTHLFSSSKLCLLPGLKSLTTCLKSLQTSEDSYDNEEIKMRSVTKQYLDALGKDNEQENYKKIEQASKHNLSLSKNIIKTKVNVNDKMKSINDSDS